MQLKRNERGELVRIPEVQDIHQSSTHEFGRVLTYHSTEMRDGQGEVVNHYESQTEVMARLANDGWETISIVPSQTHTWIDIYVRRPLPADAYPDHPSLQAPGLHVAYQAAFSDGTVAKGRVTCKSGPVTSGRLRRIEAEIKKVMQLRGAVRSQDGASVLDITVISWQDLDGIRSGQVEGVDGSPGLEAGDIDLPKSGETDRG